MPKIKINKFFVIIILSEILYLSFYSVKYFKRLVGDDHTALKNTYIFLALVAILLLLFLLYLKGLNIVSKNNIPTKTIILVAIIFNFTLLFLAPIASNDVYTYIYNSRIISAHNENPYTLAYNNFPDDLLYSSIKNPWSKNTNVYGPLFTSAGAVVTFIAKDSLFLSIFLFKLLFIIFNISNIFLIKKICKSKEAIYLYACNPFILFEFALNGHNDVMYIFFILLGFTFFFKNNTFAAFLKGWVFLTLSVFVKYISILLLPLYAVFVLHKLSIKNKFYFLLFSILIFSSFSILLFLPYWNGFEIFDQLLALSNSGRIFSSMGVLFIGASLYFLNFSSPLYISKVFNKFVFAYSYFIIIIKLLFTKNFYSKKRKSDLVFYSLLIFGIFLLTFFTWLMPWYLITFITFSIIQYGFTNEKKYFFLSNISSIYGILYYILLR